MATLGPTTPLFAAFRSGFGPPRPRRGPLTWPRRPRPGETWGLVPARPVSLSPPSSRPAATFVRATEVTRRLGAFRLAISPSRGAGGGVPAWHDLVRRRVHRGAVGGAPRRPATPRRCCRLAPALPSRGGN